MVHQLADLLHLFANSQALAALRSAALQNGTAILGGHALEEPVPAEAPAPATFAEHKAELAYRSILGRSSRINILVKCHAIEHFSVPLGNVAICLGNVFHGVIAYPTNIPAIGNGNRK